MTDEIKPTVAENATTEPVLGSGTANAFDSLSEDLRAGLGDIKDVEGLAKSYVNAQRMIGNSIRIPSEDAGEEAIKEFYQRLADVPGVTQLPDFDSGEGVDHFYNKLGRPESADKYHFETPEGIELDSDATVEFSQMAHKIGLTQKQANELVAYEVERMSRYNEQIAKDSENAQRLLQQKWGADYENRMAGAKQVLQKYAGEYPDAVNSILNSSAANNPAVVAMLSDLYGSLQETGAILPEESRIHYGTTPDEAMAQIKEIMENKAHPYHNDKDREHQAAVLKVHKLYSAAYPE